MIAAQAFTVDFDPCRDGNPDGDYIAINGEDVATGKYLHITGFMSPKQAKLFAASLRILEAMKSAVAIMSNGIFGDRDSEIVKNFIQDANSIVTELEG